MSDEDPVDMKPEIEAACKGSCMKFFSALEACGTQATSSHRLTASSAHLCAETPLCETLRSQVEAGHRAECTVEYFEYYKCVDKYVSKPLHLEHGCCV